MNPDELAQLKTIVADVASAKSDHAATSLLASAAVGAIFALLVNWLKSYRDTVQADARELNEAILEAADLASEYWLSTSKDQLLVEARLFGFQTRIALLAETYLSAIRKFDADALRRDQAELFDALTGGTFGAADHTTDPFRARHAQVVASQMVARTKIAFSKSWSLIGLFSRKVLYID